MRRYKGLVRICHEALHKLKIVSAHENKPMSETVTALVEQYVHKKYALGRCWTVEKKGTKKRRKNGK